MQLPVMKKLAVLSLMLFTAWSANAAGWVYMGLYPYMYDSNLGQWSRSAEPFLYHQNVYSGQWYQMGAAPPRYAPNSLIGLGIDLYLPAGRLIAGFDSSNQAIAWTPQVNPHWMR